MARTPYPDLEAETEYQKITDDSSQPSAEQMQKAKDYYTARMNITSSAAKNDSENAQAIYDDIRKKRK